MTWLQELLGEMLGTILNVLPIAGIIVGFQALVIRRPLPHLRQVIIGFFYVLLGITLFLTGLEQALFPLGKMMAAQLTDPAFLQNSPHPAQDPLGWQDYYWVYLFGFTLGFSTTLAEPALLAVALKANEVSGGAIGVWGLRIAVALGAALGITLGVFRLITGIPLPYFITIGYIIILVQTCFAPRLIIALAYDSGGVTTSTVTVPLVTALGLGLASTVPGRSPLLDGFGLVAFTCLFPMMSVMGYAQLSEWLARRYRRAEPS